MAATKPGHTYGNVHTAMKAKAPHGQTNAQPLNKKRDTKRMSQTGRGCPKILQSKKTGRKPEGWKKVHVARAQSENEGSVGDVREAGWERRRYTSRQIPTKRASQI